MVRMVEIPDNLPVEDRIALQAFGIRSNTIKWIVRGWLGLLSLGLLFALFMIARNSL